jgi:hypothetical protein
MRLFSTTRCLTHDLTFVIRGDDGSLTHGNLQIAAVRFRTLPGTTAIFLSVAEKADLAAAPLKALGKCSIGFETVSMRT